MDGIKSFGYQAIVSFLLSPRYQAVVLIRWQQYFSPKADYYCRKWANVFGGVVGLFYLYLSKLIARLNFTLNGGIDVSPIAQIGRYLFLACPTGVTFGGDCVIGEHLIIHQGVNIGERNGKFPTIRNNVHIYSGAHVLGGVSVGDNSIIGAMTLVIKDVEPGTVVAGIPAKIIRSITDKG